VIQSLAFSQGLEAARTGADPSGMYYNTATFRHSDWPFHEAVRAPPSLHAYLTVSSFRPSFKKISFASLLTPLRSFTHRHPPSSHMCTKRKDELIHVHVHVHPPFPSFAWVMTAQANPPAQAYTYGYIRNAQALHPRRFAHRATPPGCQRPSARSSRTPPPPVRAKIEPCDEKFMVSRSTIDFLVACGERKLNTYPLRFRKR
jgi:hypothetical protein